MKGMNSEASLSITEIGNNDETKKIGGDQIIDKEKEATHIREENKTLEADPPCSKETMIDGNHKPNQGKTTITGERRTSARLEKTSG